MDAHIGRMHGRRWVIYTENYFMCPDRRRLWFPYIHTYSEVIWAYKARSVFEISEMGQFQLPLPMIVKHEEIVFQVADGRKYGIPVPTENMKQFQEYSILITMNQLLL